MPRARSGLERATWQRKSRGSANLSAHLGVKTRRTLPLLLWSHYMNQLRNEGNAECGMRNGECGMGNAECGMRNAECGMGNAEWGMRNGEWGMGNGKN